MKTPELYLAIHKKIVSKTEGETVEWNKLMDMFGRVFHIPKASRAKVIKEMEGMGLLTKLDKFKVQVHKF